MSLHRANRGPLKNSKWLRASGPVIHVLSFKERHHSSVSNDKMQRKVTDKSSPLLLLNTYEEIRFVTLSRYAR